MKIRRFVFGGVLSTMFFITSCTTNNSNSTLHTINDFVDLSKMELEDGNWVCKDEGLWLTRKAFYDEKDNRIHELFYDSEYSWYEPGDDYPNGASKYSARYLFDTYHTYDKYCRTLEEIYERISPSWGNNGWIKADYYLRESYYRYRNVCTYDEKGHGISSIHESLCKEIDYSEDKKIISTNIIEDRKSEYKYDNSYDEFGRMVSQVTYKKENNEMNLSSKYEYSYNDNKRVQTIYNYKNGDWELRFTNTYEYYETETGYSIVDSYDGTNGNPSTKTISSYDNHNRLVSEDSYKKEFDSSNWLYDYGYSYEYKDNVIIMNNYSGTQFGKEGEKILVEIIYSILANGKNDDYIFNEGYVFMPLSNRID